MTSIGSLYKRVVCFVGFELKGPGLGVTYHEHGGNVILDYLLQFWVTVFMRLQYEHLKNTSLK